MRIKRTALAAWTLGSLVVPPTTGALEIFSDDKNSFGLRGFVNQTYLNAEDTDRLIDAGSRWGFEVTRKVSEGWTAGLTTEWGLNFERNKDFSINRLSGSAQAPLGAGDDAMFARLGYIYARHDRWGTIGVGKQWGAYFFATEGTDAFNVWGTNASGAFNLGTDGGLSGTGRAEQAITYRNSWEKFDLNLQVQLQDEIVRVDDPESPIDGAEVATVGNGVGASVLYRAKSWVFGVGYNISDIDVRPEFGSGATDEAAVVSLTYGTKGAPGFYFSGLYAVTENHEMDDQRTFFDSTSYEAVVEYTLDNRFAFYVGTSHLEPDDETYEGQYELSYNLGGVDYSLDNGLSFYMEGRVDDGSTSEGVAVDGTQFGIGVTFLLF